LSKTSVIAFLPVPGNQHKGFNLILCTFCRYHFWKTHRMCPNITIDGHSHGSTDHVGL